MSLSTKPSGWPCSLIVCKLLGIWVGVCHSSVDLTEEIKRETQVKGNWRAKGEGEGALSDVSSSSSYSEKAGPRGSQGSLLQDMDADFIRMRTRKVLGKL